MGKIRRIGVSLEERLLEQLDEFSQEKGYPSRSEAIRDMVRDRLNDESLRNPSESSVGSITLLYKHHERGLSDKLTEFQHRYHDLIISMTHIHLDRDQCLEILVCKGKAKAIKDLADGISAIKGVRYGGLSLAGIGDDKRHISPHRHGH